MTTKMLSETLQSGEVLTNQWNQNAKLRQEIAQAWKHFNPYSFLTVARGSSDHAAQYFNYLVSLKLGKLTTSLTPSLISLYQTQIDCSRSIAVAISQSGKSPDLIAPFETFAKNHYESLALVNEVNSPLATKTKYVYPLMAGPELSVAATKTFIASLFASASLLAEYAQDGKLLKALPQSVEALSCSSSPWPQIVEALKNCHKTMIVGRGLGFSIALEAALKLKETCHIQAEAFSAAEIKHGPQAVIEPDYPLIIFALRGPTQSSLLELAKEMRLRGARVFVISDRDLGTQECLYNATTHEELDALSAIHSFYLSVEELARARGLDPDKPRSLSKVTLTL